VLVFATLLPEILATLLSDSVVEVGMKLALEELADQVKGDMRMALNQMQYMSLRSPIVNYADMRTRLMMSAKDEDMSPFSAVDKLLGYEGGRLRMDDRMDAAMSDMDLVPLLIQENYLNYRPSAAGRDDNGVERMDLATRAATSIADGDVVNVQIRRFRQWQHAQMGAFMSSIIPYVVSTLSESSVWDPTNLKKMVVI
jgi:replication factor C subunit 1